MPASPQDWVALITVLSAFVGVIAWIARHFHTDLTRRLDAINDWQEHMKDDYLPTTYARKDVIESQMDRLTEGQARMEIAMKEVKTDVRDTVHALRNDLLALFKIHP